MENKMKKDSSASGILFVGCLFIGLGLGILFNEVVAGLLVGLGTGFLSMGIICASFRQKYEGRNEPVR